MSPLEWLVAAGTLLGSGAAAFVTGRNRAPAPPPPPAPAPTHREANPPDAVYLAPASRGTLAEADLEALRGRLTAVEQRGAAIEDRVEANETRAQNFRERVIAKLARIFERLKITEETDGDRGSR